jgi:4-hydroxy-tetrahydrodipicolinate synthase
MPIQGLYAAVIIPRRAEGEVDEPGFRRILEFLRAQGIARVVVNGATGEYPMTTSGELARLLAICRDVLGREGEFLCGAGAASVDRARELARVAAQAGAGGILLPMPFFFPYAQDDLQAFCRAVAETAELPVLLYNLPRFTTPLELETVLSLLDAAPQIVGIKDSSGSLAILRALQGSRACRIVGDDSVLVAALDEGVCDGVISGVAGVLPELTTFLFHQRQSPHYRDAAALLTEFIARLSVFPVPWGLKLVAECRGLAPAHFPQPLSDRRVAQASDFRAWFARWWDDTGGRGLRSAAG